MRALKPPLPALALLAAALPAAGLADRSPPGKPAGPDRRVPWTTSRVKGSPEPPPPYRLEVAFPKIKFFEPLELTAATGTRRLFVAQRPGKVHSFVPDPKNDRADLLIDVKKIVYGLAFHPKFDKNGYFYVTYIVDAKQDLP